MDNVNLKVYPTADGILTILQGKAREPLPTHEPEPLRFEGQIDSVSEFIAKKLKTINVVNSHIVVNREDGWIALVTNENEHYQRMISGKLLKSEDMGVFSINTGRMYNTFDLAKLIRMNRYFFNDKSTAMALVTELKKFKAKVTKDLEKADNGQGDAKLLKEQVVDHNIPKDFQLTMQVYQRCEPVSFMVEVVVDANTLEVSLESPDLREHEKGIKEEILKEEIEKITKLLPDLAILNQ